MTLHNYQATADDGHSLLFIYIAVFIHIVNSVVLLLWLYPILLWLVFLLCDVSIVTLSCPIIQVCKNLRANKKCMELKAIFYKFKSTCMSSVVSPAESPMLYRQCCIVSAVLCIASVISTVLYRQCCIASAASPMLYCQLYR